MENPARILIVDDEPSITEFVSYAMQKEGYLTEVASNGEEALEKIESDHFDLFILDIMLPGIDGYELCRRILRIIDGETFSLEEMDKCRIEIMHRYPSTKSR